MRATRRRRKQFADTWGYASVETDWRKLVERTDIDAVDICVPNNLHHDIAIAAASAGKMILCEKPLSMNAAEGEEMVAAVEKAGVPNTVWYNYRRVPAVTLAKQLIDEGRLGRIFHYRANFLQDWTISADLPQGGAGLWRIDVRAAGSGVTGDLLAHCIDTALWLNGPIKSVTAMTETFVKERKHTESGKVEPVGIDDACAFLCRFANGSLAIFESTRYARGHKALYTFEINGADASIAWDLHDLHRLSYFDHRDESIVRGWRIGSRHRRRHALHGQVVGAGPADRLRAHVRPPRGRLPRRPGEQQAHVAHLPRSAGDAKSLRRRARQRQERPMDGNFVGRVLAPADSWHHHMAGASTRPTKIMPNYRRLFVPGGTYFFTLVTHQRRSFLTEMSARRCLRRAFREVRKRRRFVLDAFVLLPDHLHCVWTLPSGDANYSVRWRQIKMRFTQMYLESGGVDAGVSNSRARKGERGVWQSRYFEHTVRDEKDLKHCIDYAHTNPLKHGLVSRVRDWPWSSFRRYVHLGEYSLEWGSSPEFYGDEWLRYE